MQTCAGVSGRSEGWRAPWNLKLLFACVDIHSLQCLQGGLCSVVAEELKDGLFHRGVTWVPVTCELPQGRKSWGLMDALESNWEASLSLGRGRSLTAQCSWKLGVQEPAWGCSWGCSWEPRQGTGHHSLHWHRIFLRVGITHWWIWEFGIFSTMLT